MELLKRRRAEVRRTLKACRAALSPIRRLPPEILGLIFSEGVGTTYFFGDISEVQPPVTQHAPWLFTRVCRHWSAVALATPSLWALMFVDLDRMGVRGAIPLTKLYIERSRNVPLTLKIFHERGVEPHPVLDVLLSSSAQWRVADLYMTPPVLQQITRVQNGFPILRTLRISVDFAMDDDFPDVSSLDQVFWDVFSTTPELRHVQAHSWAISGFIRPPFTLPWHQLTVLSTTTTSNIEALAVLEKLLNINKCTIAFSENLILIRDHGTVHLPYLRALALQIEDEDGVVIYEKHTSILDFLETPSLTSLVLFSTADEEAVLGLITRSNCASSLTSLHLHSHTIYPDLALRLTTKLPCLTFLELGDFDGKLSPDFPLPLPDFVHHFSQQWLKTQKANDGRQTLSLRVRDRALEAKDAQRITVRYRRLERDRLFIKVLSAIVYPSIITEHFEY
ncbi:F-box domain-containing protein [Favolaschia claudopus]|uniref:F-box domain-containing protein n=1 Tax=Favolaschia claudopus TaxID=2862362 RepID=A0AAW0CHC7_9AGAR